MGTNRSLAQEVGVSQMPAILDNVVCDGYAIGRKVRGGTDERLDASAASEEERWLGTTIGAC